MPVHPMTDLRIDPERCDGWDDRTGIYVRAVTDDGRWDSVDMAVLDKESFTEFVTSRGEVSDWALGIFYALFGYPRVQARSSSEREQ